MNQSFYQIAHAHWKEFLPKMYKILVDNRTLLGRLEAAASQTDLEMTQAMDSGMPREQAWESIRGCAQRVRISTESIVPLAAFPINSKAA